MKNLLLLNAFLLLLAGLIWSCNIDQISNIDQDSSPLGEHVIMYDINATSQVNTYYGPEIPLLNKQGQQVGKLIVFNTTKLHVEFIADNKHTINNVQLWVGTEIHDVPANKQGIPTPGKFTYKASDQTEYNFTIELADILTNYTPLLDGTQPIYIYAHAEMQNTQTSTALSAWSEGTSFETTRWGSFSEFICQETSGGRGCYLLSSNSGIEYNGTFYYNNKIGGLQNIYTEYGKVVGTVQYENKKLYFVLIGNWFISDLALPPLTYRCFSEPGSSESETVEVNFLTSGGPKGYYATVPESNYYLLDLKIQYCD